jgi:hypothetical protein
VAAPTARPRNYRSTSCRLGEHHVCTRHPVVLCSCPCHNRSLLLVPDADTEDRPLSVGTRVYVRNKYEGTFGSGFEIAEVLATGYLLMRMTDGQVFTEVFAFDDVHRERRSDPFRQDRSPDRRGPDRA